MPQPGDSPDDDLATDDIPPIETLASLDEDNKGSVGLDELEALLAKSQTQPDAALEADLAQNNGVSETAPTPSSAPRKKKGKAKQVNRTQARRFARERCLQALYQWEMSGSDASSVRADIVERQQMGKVDIEFFHDLFNGISHDPDAVDAVLSQALDRPVEDLDPIERSVLRVATYELQHRLETPARVVINEGVEITKRFGADQGHKYVNGVLDKLARRLRELEMQRR